jgi:hypothetical protein
MASLSGPNDMTKGIYLFNSTRPASLKLSSRAYGGVRLTQAATAFLSSPSSILASTLSPQTTLTFVW